MQGFRIVYVLFVLLMVVVMVSDMFVEHFLVMKDVAVDHRAKMSVVSVVEMDLHVLTALEYPMDLLCWIYVVSVVEVQVIVVIAGAPVLRQIL